MELYEYMKALKEDLQYSLKMKTVVYMLDNRDAITYDPTIMETSFTDGPEDFNVYVRVGDKTICHRQFDGKMFPPKVRYTVDVRPFIKNILRDLTDIFSETDLSYDYLEFDLSK